MVVFLKKSQKIKIKILKNLQNLRNFFKKKIVFF